MPNRRILRINELLREELALLLRDVKDPELVKLISITEVDTSPDMRNANVFVSVLGDEDEIVKTIGRLQHAARFFRRELAARVNLRHTPALQFRPDPSIARGARVMELLNKVKSEETGDTF